MAARWVVMGKHYACRIARQRTLDQHPVASTDRGDPAADADSLADQPPSAIEGQFHKNFAAQPAQPDYQRFE